MTTERHTIFLADSSKMLQAEQQGDITAAVREYTVDIDAALMTPGHLLDDGEINAQTLSNAHDEFFDIPVGDIKADGKERAFYTTAQAAVNAIIKKLEHHYGDSAPCHPEFIEQLKQLPKGWTFQKIRTVMFFSPAGQEPKVFSIKVVPGKTKLIKRQSYCVTFLLNDREYIADSDSWRQREANGYIYALAAR